MDGLDVYAGWLGVVNVWNHDPRNEWAALMVHEMRDLALAKEGAPARNCPVVWTWAAMMARTRVEWQRSEDEGA